MSVWRERARRRIDELVRGLPETATIAERRKTLWGKGEPAHQGTSWGRKMWGKEVRAYLARHGDGLAHANKPGFQWPDDIAFPYRKDADA